MSLQATKTTLFTSIQPNIQRVFKQRACGDVYQSLVLNSWGASGFHIVSLNHQQEIPALVRLYPYVEFIPIEGKVPKITDFLQKMTQAKSEIVGIINADVLLRINEADRQNLLGRAKDGLVVSRRVDIDHLSGEISLLPGGLDVFFFAKNLISEPMRQVFAETEAMIGSPLWDLVFPSLFVFEGRKLYIADRRSIAYHLTHQVQWDEARLLTMRNAFFEAVQRHYDKNALASYLFSQTERRYLDARLNDVIRQHGVDLFAPTKMSDYFEYFFNELVLADRRLDYLLEKNKTINITASYRKIYPYARPFLSLKRAFFRFRSLFGRTFHIQERIKKLDELKELGKNKPGE